MFIALNNFVSNMACSTV